MRAQYNFGNAVCVLCGMDFTLRRKVDNSSYFGKYCSRKCSDAAVKANQISQRVQKICAFCGAPFEAKTSQQWINCCSVKCGKRLTAITMHGTAHPLYKPKTEMACVICGKKRMVKPSLVARFRCCSRRCASIYGQTVKQKPSSIEETMATEFASLGLSFERQYIIGRWSCDFAFVDHRVVVECDGTYWHSLPRRKQLDSSKDTQLKNHGWVVIRLPESAIRDDSLGCANAVLARLLHLGSVQMPTLAPEPMKTASS